MRARTLPLRPAQVRNVTSVIRNLRMLPPASQYFHMSMLSFPTDNGCIAPGMAAELTLRFTPDSLADYDDVMVVDTLSNRFPVQLQVCMRVCGKRECACPCARGVAAAMRLGVHLHVPAP